MSSRVVFLDRSACGFWTFHLFSYLGLLAIQGFFRTFGLMCSNFDTAFRMSILFVPNIVQYAGYTAKGKKKETVSGTKNGDEEANSNAARSLGRRSTTPSPFLAALKGSCRCLRVCQAGYRGGSHWI